MKVFNVEFFDPDDLSLAYHTNISSDSISFEDDYLSPAKNSIEVLAGNIAVEQYVLIYLDNERYFGIVSDISAVKQGKVTVSFCSFLYGKFNVPILFNTDLQGVGSLEDALATIIRSYWISNSDSLQNVYGLNVSSDTATSGWGFNLKSDSEGQHHLICNFFNTFIVRSMEKYQVKINVNFDAENKRIELAIGKDTHDAIYIEADLKTVVSKNVLIKKTSNTVNKLVVWNEENYNQSVTYYRHTDDSYDTVNSDRITPVIFDTRSVSAEEGSSFADSANAVASEVLGALVYDNYIELEFVRQDTLVNPLGLSIGQICNVISGEKVYPSILTGRIVKSGKVTLLFGTVRIDLTKILKKEGY